MLTTSFPRFEGDSAGIFIHHLSKWLSQKGIDVEVICPHDPGYGCFERWGKVRINRFPYFYPLKYQRLCYGSGILKNVSRSKLATIQFPFFIFAEALYVSFKVRKLNADIIHAHWSLPQGLIAVLLKGIHKIPCVTTIHGSDIFGLKNPILNALNAKVIKNSDKCSANSMATARTARKISGREDIEIIPMGVDIGLFRRSSHGEVMGKKSKTKEKNILFVGRLIELKGVEYLIRALPMVLDKHPEAKLVLVGSGPEKKNLLNLSKNLNLEEKVTFIDRIPQRELTKFYSNASVFVLPSIVNEKQETEGLGLVLLEAIACGVPVIGSNVGGIPDIIEDGETGLLARQKNPHDLATKIIHLLTDETLKKNLIENGIKFVKENFAWEVVADRFIKTYQDVLERNTLRVKSQTNPDRYR